MIKVAIIEDDNQAAEVLIKFLDRYSKEKNITFGIDHFTSAIAFLDNHKNNYDLVFMDIELPSMDGMTAAKMLRERDSYVTLIFVTNMAQFAIKGYEVNALDFIVKPIHYHDFSFRVEKAVAKLLANQDKFIMLHDNRGSYQKINTSHIKYIEITNHKMIYHCIEGNFETYGSLKNVENVLSTSCFVRCNSCYLVNLNFVYSVKDFIVDVGGDKLKISQPKKKDFMKALNEFIGGGFNV